MPKCDTRVIIKQECVSTKDIIILRPIDGSARIFSQGDGIKRSTVTIAGELDGLSCDVFGADCSGSAKIGSSEVAYSGTPYKISTIRCMS